MPPALLPLADWLRRGPLPPQAAGELLLVLFEPLRPLHAAGQGHGRLHPLSLQLRLDQRIIPIEPAPPPAVDYVPPEGGGTSAGDVYTLGTIFYEALTARPLGHLPEREILHGSTLDRLIRQMESTPASLRGLLKSMLDFRPEARPTLLQASETLMRCLPSLPGPDLGAWLSHQPEEADAPTAVISAMPPPPPPTPISASSPPTILRPPPRTAQKGVSVWIWVAAGVGLLGVCCGLLTILTGVGAWFLYR